LRKKRKTINPSCEGASEDVIMVDAGHNI